MTRAGAQSRIIVVLGLLAVLCTSALADPPPVQTWAAPAYNTNASSTIAVTDTFQVIWSKITPGSALRKGCLIINTSTNRQWVYFGDTPVKANAVPLEPAAATAALGGNVSCATASGAASQDKIWITGTAGDTYVATME